MAQVLPLTKKQIKKLGKFFKNDIQYRRDNFEFAGGPGMRPPGGRPPMMGGEVDIEEIEKYNQSSDGDAQTA